MDQNLLRQVVQDMYAEKSGNGSEPAITGTGRYADTSGGIVASLTAQPGMMEQTAREGLLSPQPAAEANQDGMTAMSSADDSWKSPLSGVLDEYGIGQYEPGKNAPRDPFSTIQNRNDTLRGQMAERDSLRSELGLPGDEGGFSSDLQRAAFMLNAASQYSQDDAFSAFAISKALNMPFAITLDNKEVARNLANEFTPEKIKDFAPRLIRLAQYDYDSVLLWRHDLATANAVAGAFEGLDSNRLGGLSGGLRYAGADGLLPDDPGSNASAAARGFEKGALGIAQGLLTAGKFGVELSDRMGQSIAEGISSTLKLDALPVDKHYTEPQKVSQWLGDLAQSVTTAMGDVSEDATYARKAVWDNPEVMLDSRWWLENGISTVMSSLPAIAAYAAGGALPAAAAGMAMEGANIYNDLIAEGLPDDARTRAYSAVYSVIAGALEATGVESMLGGSAAVKASFKNMLKGAAEGGAKQAAKHSAAHVAMGFLGEGGTEWLQNIAQGGLESAAKGNTGEQIFNDVLASAKELENLILGGVFGGAMAGVHSRAEVRGERLNADIAESVRRAANAPEMVAAREEIEAITRESGAAQSRMAFAQSLEKAAAAADSSTMHQADPDLFEQEAAKLIPEEARTVWLDVATVQEFTRGDPARLEALGLTQQNIDEAVSTGASGVQVPTMAIVSRFQGEERQTLMQSARSELGGMTQEEAHSFDPAARSEEAANRIRSVSQTSAEVNKEKTRLKQEFVQAGYPAHMAEYYATLHAAQARAFADRYGLDPVLLLRQRSVVQGNPEEVPAGALHHPLNAGVNLEAPVRVVAVQPQFEGKSPWELMKGQGKKALSKAVVGTYTNNSTGWKISVTMHGAEHAISSATRRGVGGIEHLEAVANLPSMLENAVLVESHTDNKEQGLAAVHRMYAPMALGKDMYAVKLTVKQAPEGMVAEIEDVRKLYDLSLEKKMPGDLSAPPPAAKETLTGSATPTPGISEITLRRLLEGVNDHKGNRFFQPAYHGSPYRFDKFTLDHMGMGEGNQAFGWGMYFAGKKSVAEFYRETLSKDKLDENPEIKLKLKAALQDVDYLGFDNFGQAVSAISTHSDWAKRWEVTPNEAENINALLKEYRRARDGQLYRVDIPEDNQLLLWDKPRADQSEEVRKTLEKENLSASETPYNTEEYRTAWKPLEGTGLPLDALITMASYDKKNGSAKVSWVPFGDAMMEEFGKERETVISGADKAEVVRAIFDMQEDWLGADGKLEDSGAKMYSELSKRLGSDSAASEYLNSLGIKGIKYLDGASRSAGEGSHNYVIFDDSAINILQTYYQQQRGAVSFGASGDSITSIFKDASDPSTPIHEGAHVFINDLIRVVADDGRMLETDFHQRISANNADAKAGVIDEKLRKRRERAITQNYETRRRNIHWTARGDLEALVANANAQREAHGKAIGEDLVEVPLEAALNGSLTPEQMKTLQEVNATGFEAYVREGNAPSDALRGVFHRMKEWLKAIYRALTVNGVQPTPEVARVFDRMLATDAAIDSSKAGAAMSNEAEFFEAINGLGDAEWSKKDRINYKAALNKDGDEFQRLHELYNLAEAEVSARMDKEALKERNQRWKGYYAEGKEIAQDDVFYDVIAALTAKTDVPFSGISREWLERMYGKVAVADLRKTAMGRKIINSEGGMPLDAVGIADIVGNSDRAEAMGLSDADGLYNYLYDNIVVRQRSLARDAKAYADQRLADDDRQAEKTADVPGEAYRKYLDEVEATVLRMAAREGAAWRTPEQQARWIEQNRLTLATVRRQVREVLRGKPLRDIMPNMYVGEVRAALQDRNAALLAGNARDALAAVDRARTALESWIEANRIIKEREAFEKQAARLAVVKRDVVAPEAYTAIQDLLERFQTVPKRAFRDTPKPLQEVVDNLAAASGAVQSGPAVAEWLLTSAQEVNYKDLNVEQLQDVKDLLAMLERTGRDVLASNKASEAARVKEVADAGADSMAGLKPDILAAAGSALRGWQDWNRKFFSSFAAIQWQMRQADGFTNVGPKGKRGVNEMRIYGAIVEGESRREIRMRALTDRLAPVFQRLAESAKRMEIEKGKAFVGADGKPLAVPASMRQISRNNWTADNVIAMALNLGNEGNAARLREGFPDLKPEVLAHLLGDDATRLVFKNWAGKGHEGLLTAKDWRGVQEIWDTLHTQWSDIRATHERLYGFKPRGVEAREISLSLGGKAITLPGGYYPAVYDPQLSKEVAGRNEKQDALARGEAIYAVPAARKGFTQGRANSGAGKPLMLSTGVVMSHLNDVTRFIELAETVRFADRVTQSPQWAQAYTAAFGSAQYDAIRPNLKNIVLEDRPPMDAYSIAAEKARAHLIPWGLAWNFKTALLQSTALFPAMNDLGAANVMRGVSALGLGRYALVKEIWEISPYMKSRASNIDQDLRQAVKSIDERTRQKAVKLLGAEVTWDKVVEAGMLPLLTVDMATSSAIWLAAYNKEMVSLVGGPAGKRGIDPSSKYHKAAVLAADMAVKAVNPDFNPSSRSAFLRDRGVVRLLNMFSSAVVLFAQRRAYNAEALKQAWHQAGKDKKGKLSAVGSYARYEAYDFLLPAVAMGLLQSLAGGSDDPNKWAKNIGSAYLDAFAMRLPVAGGVISGLITNETWRGMSTVFEQPVRMGQRVAGALHSGDKEKMVGSMADALSFLTKLPVSRVVRSGMRGYDQWQRGEGTPLSLIMPSQGQ